MGWLISTWCRYIISIDFWIISVLFLFTLSEAWSGVNWTDLMVAQGAFGIDFYDRSILRPKNRAYYRSGRPVIKIGPKGTLGSHEIRPIHSSPSLGQSIEGNVYLDMYVPITEEYRVRVGLCSLLRVWSHLESSSNLTCLKFFGQPWLRCASNLDDFFTLFCNVIFSE